MAPRNLIVFDRDELYTYLGKMGLSIEDRVQLFHDLTVERYIADESADEEPEGEQHQPERNKLQLPGPDVR